MPIPPPPPGPPPPPAPPSFDLKVGGAPDPNGRNLLLQSIRQGAKLKKPTVVNDRSSPLVSGNANKNNGGSPSSGGGGGHQASSGGFGGGRPAGPGPLGLGDLFAGGIPKLKPVGSSGARSKGFSSSASSLHNKHESSTSSIHNRSHNSGETVSINSYSSSTSSIHVESSNSSSIHNSPHMSMNHKAPPPPPPPSNLKPSLTNFSEQASEQHRKPINYGKPSLAPKPPGINGGIVKSSKPNPPPKLPSLHIPPPPPLPAADYGGDTQQMPSTPPSAGSGSSVNRAQSMRMARTASPASPNAASIEYRTMGRSAGREFMNASGQPPPPPRIVTNIVPRVRMSPLRPPSARPPPPPNKAPPAVPPPPPPSSAPPPPRHRISPAPTPPQVRVNGSLGPLPPVPVGGPPPPPTRNSSMRSVNSGASINSISSGSGSSTPSIYTGVDLETRYGHLFPSLEELPPPGMFMGITKTYPSKNAAGFVFSAHSIKRQPAPQPPTQMQLGSKMWENNTSTC